MSLWSDDPEYFDEWIEEQALEGEFGPEVCKQVEDGLLGYGLWDMLLKGKIHGKRHQKDYEYARDAEIDYIERFIP